MARKTNRGAHQSTSKKARRTLDALESLPGVEAVMIGYSFGGKSLHRGASEGAFKIQREEEAGFKGALQTSRGIQEIFIRVKAENKPAFLLALEEKGI
jgi:hypothetical protein